MKGKIEIIKFHFKSDIIAKAARVIPIAKDPVFPTKTIPLKFKKESVSHTAKGIVKKMAFCPEAAMSPIITMAGHTVSKPFNPPN